MAENVVLGREKKTGEGSIPATVGGSSRVLVFSNFSGAEIEKPGFGGSRLIAAQVATLRDHGYDTQLVDLEKLAGATGLALRLAGWIRRRRKRESGFLAFRDAEGEQRVWRFNMLFHLLVEMLSRLDIVAYRRIARLFISGANNLALWNYPFGIRILCRARDRIPGGGMHIAIYEHNVEGDFYNERVGTGSFFKTLAGFFARIELSNLSLADQVFCATSRDRERLESLGLEPGRMEVWVPKPRPSGGGHTSILVPAALAERLGDRYVIGFIGSDYGPNVVAVQNILGMAEMLGPEVAFLVIGSVCDRFSRETIPDNVLLAGFVEDLEAYLRLCDAFISPKTTSDTGVEIKMMDYTAEGKPVFATAAGARGFEDYHGLMIAEMEEMPEAIRSLAVRQP